jgi:ABC-2 type transport system ATP-binding protein
VAWDLIREIRHAGTTVVLVTHYMDEAEQLCDRVAVVDRGRVVAMGSPQELIARSQATRTVRFSAGHQDLSWLDGLEDVQKVVRHGEAVEVRGTGPLLAVVAAELVSHGMVPEDLRVEQPGLEDVFLTLTGRTERGEW